MAKFDIYRRPRGYVGNDDFGRVGVIEADSAEEADRLWWETHPDHHGLVVAQWAKIAARLDLSAREQERMAPAFHLARCVAG